jgi:NAD(P)-dependent dehydrogenase (short-subunit alcohol dehydrogenase family)
LFRGRKSSRAETNITHSLLIRYNVSKLIQLLLARELASQITRSAKPGTITVNVVNPGFVKTEIMRSANADAGTLFNIFFAPLRAVLARSAEAGSRTIVHGAAGGRETHGQYLSDCAVTAYVSFLLPLLSFFHCLASSTFFSLGGKREKKTSIRLQHAETDSGLHYF